MKTCTSCLKPIPPSDGGIGLHCKKCNITYFFYEDKLHFISFYIKKEHNSTVSIVDVDLAQDITMIYFEATSNTKRKILDKAILADSTEQILRRIKNLIAFL